MFWVAQCAYFEEFCGRIINKKGNIIRKIQTLSYLDGVLYFTFIYLHQRHSLFFDTNTNNVIQCGALMPDENHLFLGENELIGQTENELIFKLNPSSAVGRYKELKTMEYKSCLPKYKELFESGDFNQNSNPALLFFKMKNR